MKRALMLVSIAFVFSLALFANAYAGSSGDQSSQGQEMRAMAPFETPGSTSGPSGGFGYYGASDRAPQIERPETRIQAHFGQAPAITEEGGQPYCGYLVNGSTTSPSGGFGTYGAGDCSVIGNPEANMQNQYGQAPASTEEGHANHMFEATPGTTSSPSGGFGYY